MEYGKLNQTEVGVKTRGCPIFVSSALTQISVALNLKISFIFSSLFIDKLYNRITWRGRTRQGVNLLFNQGIPSNVEEGHSQV